ncbi:MAG: hypothetical protein PPP58_06100 [Natronomonas sp.]
MAPPKNLVTGVCVIVAAPIGYGVYQTVSLLAGVVALLIVGVVIPQVYAQVAVEN